MRIQGLGMRELGIMAAGLLAAGCSHKPTVVGTWNATTTERGAPVTLTMTLTDDGKETIKAEGTTPLGPVSMQGTGTYTATDTALTQKMTSFTVTMNGKSQPGGPSANQTETDTYKLDGDTLTLTPPSGKAQTFTRAKS